MTFHENRLDGDALGVDRRHEGLVLFGERPAVRSVQVTIGEPPLVGIDMGAMHFACGEWRIRSKAVRRHAAERSEKSTGSSTRRSTGAQAGGTSQTEHGASTA